MLYGVLVLVHSTDPDAQIMPRWADWERRQWDAHHPPQQRVVRMDAYLEHEPIPPLPTELPPPRARKSAGREHVYAWPTTRGAGER